MVAEIKAAAKVGDSLGGVAEVIGYGVPVGLGSHVHWDRKLDGLLAQALMSIQAVKGGRDRRRLRRGRAPRLRGPRPHHAGTPTAGPTAGRPTGRGGIEGGMTNGEPVVARVAMKPLATLNRPVLKTVDVVTKEETVSFKERTDVTAVPAMGVVAETMMALVLAGEALRKFGGDSMAEVRAQHATPTCRRPAILDDRRQPARVLLIGMMGAGKSTTGHLLAARLGWPYLDSDDEIAAPDRARRCPRSGRRTAKPPSGPRRAGCSPRPTTSDGPVVVAVAGGAVLDPANRARIRERRTGRVAPGRPRRPGRPGRRPAPAARCSRGGPARGPRAAFPSAPGRPSTRSWPT